MKSAVLVLTLLIGVGLSEELRGGVVGAGMLWAGSSGRSIYTIDPTSGTATKMLDIPVGTSFINDLAFESNSGLLYGISGGLLFGRPNTLFTVNLNSPALEVNLLGTVNPPDASANYISGLAFVDGNLIASQSNGQRNALFNINRTDLSVSNVYYLPSPVNFNLTDLASPYNPGKPLALKASSPYSVFEVSLPNGPISILGNSPNVGGFHDGIAYSQERNLIYTVVGSTLAVINPLNFATQTLAIQNATFSINGIEYVPQTSIVPEPTSFWVFAIGMGAFGLRELGNRKRAPKTSKKLN
jgi:hypothetical protein